MKVKVAKIKIGVLLLTVLIAIVLMVYHQENNIEEGENRLTSEAEKIHALVYPAFVQEAEPEASFLDKEAGISIYLNTNNTIDLSKAKSVYKAIEKEDANYIIGSITLPNLPESEDLHCFIHKEGWIVVYYLKNEPVAKIIDWSYWTGEQLTKNKLQVGLEKVCNALGLPSLDARYYHFQYPYANKMIAIIKTARKGAFNIMIPSGLIVYECSWSFYRNSSFYIKFKVDEILIGECGGLCGGGPIYGNLSLSYLSPDVFHRVSIDSDNTQSCCVSLVYKESSGSSRITIEYANMITTINLQRPFFLPALIKNLTVFQADISHPLPGIVIIHYDVIDAGDSVTVSFQYWNGNQWIDCITTTGEGLISVGSNTGTWNAKADFNNCYIDNMKLKVIVDNGETLSSFESPTFTLDTKDPPSPSILSPPNGSFINKSDPTLDWSDVFDPSGVKYNLQIAEDIKFENLLLAEALLANSEYHVFSKKLKDGVYYWRVKAVDNVGNQGEWSLGRFIIDATIPKADAGSDQIVDEDTVITLDGSRSTDENGIIDYIWILPDGITLSGRIVNYMFEKPGTYLITLKVTDSAGNYATDDVVVTVLDKTKPVARATYTVISHVIAWIVKFDASDSMDNVGIISYEWDLGDGTTAIGQKIAHMYLRAGIYNVTLTVRDSANNADFISITINIAPSISHLQFSIYLTLVAVLGIVTTLTISLRKRKQIKRKIL